MTPEQATESCTELAPLGEDGLPWLFDNKWRSEDVILLARSIQGERAFDRLPILADALQESGCEDEVVLAHCRQCVTHDPDCWVVRDTIEGDWITRGDLMRDTDGVFSDEYEPAVEVVPRPVPVVLKAVQWGLGSMIAFIFLMICVQLVVAVIWYVWNAIAP